MYKLFSVLKKLTIPASISGIVCYYLNYNVIVYVCAAMLLIHSYLNVKLGKQNNLATEVLTYFIGAAVAFIFKCDFIPCVAVAFCYAELLVTISAVLSTIVLFF